MNNENLPEVIKWEAPEFEYSYKGVGWYWTSILASIVLILISIWQGNLLFIIFIIVAEILFVFWGREYPKTIQFTLNRKGISIGSLKEYAFEDFQGFHIKESESADELILKTKNRLHLYVKIVLPHSNREMVKQFISRHLPAMEYEESLHDHFSKLIGF
ncbi:MAG: hypothetical protein A2651_01635 [Candidatus Yanofskybacteria bacterium RIFCSPHIGHO2_01_FULL_42_12]|uniref:DUF5673 domain-containing protein n=1 Tax=Candidatus Harrisonbacteria bacterium RIFCSPLOWO2_02_FULL_45_10c TaxID=1798410 RepID=A0A1G1ZW50_9BACT|nr:MAG: hypothetical protein A2651_01635 [Candidatus Yanofskybacteria bacterium RIFCSPHIGHO2_01_FULL_42_12]OGY68366.1 MAG: hypothetical protein A3H63_00975 [Candidatus Harrisonbacteria bacterium RIFCSPLOWO2_02_FULL_45_10c]